MRFIIATASSGYWPEALSADSITASAPSNTAVATSETSARVGTGVVIINSSICVATTTGLPTLRAMLTMVFCKPGTRSTGISTPRSPRATMIASETAMISSSRRIACGFSILAMTLARLPQIRLTSTTSSGRCTKESATQSMFSSSAASRSARSLSVIAEVGNFRIGQADALLVRDLAGDLDHAFGVAFGLRLHAQLHLAVVDQQAVAGSQRLQDFRMRQPHAMRIARRRVVVEREQIALAQLLRAVGEQADAQLRP